MKHLVKKITLVIATALASGSAFASLQNLTTWSTTSGLNSSVSVGTNSATLSGTASIYQSFVLGAGSTFSFDWLFQANDYMPYNDWSSVFVDGNLNLTLSNVAAVGDFGSSGLQTFTTELTNPVTGNITFSVSNALDSGWSSTLTISNVNVGNNVPEPASLALVGLGLAGLAVSRRRKS